MDFNKHPVLKAKKRGCKRLLRNIRKCFHFKSDESPSHSAINIQNFDESQIDKSLAKRLPKFFKKAGGSVKELIVVDSSFKSVGSFKKFLASFQNLQKIVLSNVSFDLNAPAGADDLFLDKLHSIATAGTELQFLPAFNQCHHIKELDIQLFTFDVLQGGLMKDQMLFLEVFIERQTRLERFRLENVCGKPCFLKFFPVVGFSLKELRLRNVYFSSALMALHFMRSQHEIEQLELMLTPSQQECGYYSSYGELEDLLMHIHHNCHQLERLVLDLKDYHYWQGPTVLSRDITNNSLKTLKIRQEAIFYDGGLIHGLVAMAPNVQNFTYEDKVDTEKWTDVSAFNNFEDLRTLSLAIATNSLKTIYIPHSKLEVFEFKPKFPMTPVDDIRLLLFLKRHPSIKHATLYIHVDLEMLRMFEKIRPGENLENLIVDGFEDVKRSVEVLKEVLPKLESIAMQEEEDDDLYSLDYSCITSSSEE